MKYLVTGAAGFIGFHTAKSMLSRGDTVVSVDSLNDYYSVQLKHDRLAKLMEYSGFSFVRGDLNDTAVWDSLSRLHGSFDGIVHLAAQAGVRHSIEHPRDYTHSNLSGFLEVLEFSRGEGCIPLVYASSSSVYGANSRIPFTTSDPVQQPISFYGATKVANEAMAFSYHHLFGIPMTGLRFFTVYGPWGRPDMAYYKFAAAISAGTPIKVYSGGNMQRSFTYVDDAVSGVLSALTLNDGVHLFNIGNDESVPLMYLIECLESALGKRAVLEFTPPQLGDMQATAADISHATETLGFRPTLSLKEGIERFVVWFREYHG